MTIASQITVAVKPQFYNTNLNTVPLGPGSTLKLKIIGLQGDRALIDFGHYRATADIKIPVTLGQELTVQVLEVGRQLKLGVITADQKTPLPTELLGQRPLTSPEEGLYKSQKALSQTLNQILRSSLGKNLDPSFLSTLDRLNSYLEPFDLKQIVHDLLPRLKSHLDNSGFIFEKSLESIISRVLEGGETPPAKSLADLADVKTVVHRDLKPNLFLLQAFIEGKETLQKMVDPGTVDSLKKAIESVLGDIGRQQGRAVSQLDSTDPFQMFTYTLPLKDGQRPAKLNVFYGKKQKSGSKKGFQVSLLLSMDRLGDVRADFYLLGSDLSVTFYVTKPSAMISIKEHYPQLEQLLGGLFDQIQLKVKVSEKRVKDFDRPVVPAAGNHRVDLRV